MIWNIQAAAGGIIYGAELWGACLIFLLPLRRRSCFAGRVVLSGLLVTACFAVAEMFLGSVWERALTGQIAYGAAGYLASVFICAFCARLKRFELWYCSVWATMTGVLVLATGRLFRGLFGTYVGKSAGWTAAVLFAVAVYIVVGLTVARWMPEDGKYRIGPRQMVSAWFLCIISVTLYVLTGMEKENVLVCVMIQIYAITVLYLQSALFRKSSMQKELETIQMLWHQQKDQYQLSRETIDLINQKCHDLKHQVRAMRAVENADEREMQLEEIEKSVQIYSAIVRTGNEILDTILTEKSLICENSGIHVNCVADGSLLKFMDQVDLYTFFGNALDNSVEAVRKAKSKEERIIDIMVYERQNFLMIQVVNPIHEKVQFEDGLPLSTKPRDGYHGYGMKSMRHTIEKYGGFLSAEIKDGCFYLKAMIPSANGSRNQ